jgi:hypothetical protein
VGRRRAEREAELNDQHSPCGNASPTSTQRVAKWCERKRHGVLFAADLEVMDRDLRVLKRFGYLASDDPTAVSRDEVGDAIRFVLDNLAWRLSFSAQVRARR